MWENIITVINARTLKQEKVKKYLQSCQTLKEKKKTFNEIKCCLNEMKNAMTLKSIFKKTKIMIIDNDKMTKH